MRRRRDRGKVSGPEVQTRVCAFCGLIVQRRRGNLSFQAWSAAVESALQKHVYKAHSAPISSADAHARWEAEHED